MSRRILVTGAQGFLGRYTVMEILRRLPHAVVLGIGRSPQRDDCFTHTLRWLGREVVAPLPHELALAAGNDRYTYVAANLTDATRLAAVLAQFRPDVVFHLAASLRDEPWDRLIESNIRAGLALIEAMAASGVRPERVVLGSSGSVYGAPVDAMPPFGETAACRPIDPYAATKRAAEDIVRVAASAQGIAVVAARLFNPTGPGLQDRHLCGALAGQLAAIQLRLAPPQIRVGPLNATRDFIDVRDAVRALVLLAEAAAPKEVYNLGSGIERPARQVLELLLDAAGLTGAVDMIEQPGRTADVPRLVGDIERLRALEFAPAIPLAQSLADMLAYYRVSVSAARMAD